MNSESLGSIFLNAALVNNFVLAYFLGICPFLGVSGKMETATRMGGAVMFVMLVTSVCAYGIQALLVAATIPIAVSAPQERPARTGRIPIGTASSASAMEAMGKASFRWIWSCT